MLLALAVSVVLSPGWNPIPLSKVQIQDKFWSPRQQSLRKVTLPYLFDRMEREHYNENFRLAAARKLSGHEGLIFNDSDLYKTIEAASLSLAIHPDPKLDQQVDATIDLVAKAQMADGYINTWYQIREPDRRWTNLRDNHELYCAGHLFEAAAAHFRATGKRNLLNVAIKFADHIDSRFGPGKKMGYPGHPELELALVKLADVTGEKRYFELARFFIENRGSGYFADEHGTPKATYDGTYWLDNAPIREHRAIVGHAVRAAYLFSGVADVARCTDEAGMKAMLERVWRNTTERRMFVTGGLGPSGSNEGFTFDYDLPTSTAYQETCASIANAMWNSRMALLTGDGKYADVMEAALYNGTLSGASLEGDDFNYVNPLQSDGRHTRSPWFTCACCPPNFARTIAQLGTYAYGASDSELAVLLYVQGQASTKIGGKDVGLQVTTDYPWSGRVGIRLTKADGAFPLKLRIPAWADGASLKVNGRAQKMAVERGFATVSRDWKSGDRVDLNLPMAVRRIEANPQAKDLVGRLALARGPLIYCLEGVDNKVDLARLAVSPAATFKPTWEPNLMGGTMTLVGTGELGGTTEEKLYREYRPAKPVPIKAVPYGLWDNRGACAMVMWTPKYPLPLPMRGLEKEAKLDTSFRSGNSTLTGISDGVAPAKSVETAGSQFHWWPHKGGTEWVSYSWDAPKSISQARLFWFDDTGHGECRVPKAWRIEYRDGSTWKPVALIPGLRYEVRPDGWMEVEFLPITTREVRLVVEMQSGWAAGVHEWQLFNGEM